MELILFGMGDPFVPSPFAPRPCFPSLGRAERMTQMLLEETSLSSSPALPAWGLKLGFSIIVSANFFPKREKQGEKEEGESGGSTK